MGVRRIVLVAAALAAGIAAAAAIGSKTAFPGIPSIYVTYDINCTFSISVDGGTPLTATSPPGPTLPPGVYQVAVLMVNPATGYQCGQPVFTLTGPGVSFVSRFPYESILDNRVLPAFQPASTYVAEDENSPATTHIYFTTSATGSSSSLVSTSTTTALGPGSTEPGIVGSALPPYQGKLSASVSATGAPALERDGKTVGSLAAGRYDLIVVDAARSAGFSLRRADGKAVVVTSASYVGKKTRRITLTTGSWSFFAGAGKPGRFVVVKA